MALTNHQKPGSYEQTGVVRVNGQFTSKAQQEALGLEPGTVDKPNSYLVKPAVLDSDFTDAYESNFLNKERLQKVANVINKGIDSTDEKVAVGTAISERGDLTRVYLQKTKDRKPTQSTATISPDMLLEHASNPLAWVNYIWELDRPPNGKQIEIVQTAGNKLILMPRQCFGKTTIIAIKEIAHPMIFKPNTPILVATNVEDSAVNLIKIVKSSVKKYADLCGFLQVTKDNEKEFELSNGSRVKALSSGSTAPRGFTAKILVLDEAAYISDERFYKELLPTTASIDNPVIVASSTPNGKQGWFYKYWQEMDWKRITAKREDCTWKSDDWFAQKRLEMTDTAYRQEFECEFLDVQNAVFSVEQLDRVFDNEVKTWDL